MSHNPVTSVVGFMGASFFLVAAVLFAAIFMVMGFRSMMEHRANRKPSRRCGSSSPSSRWSASPSIA
jgi:hypothetical protein